MNEPALETERLVLRTMQATDADALWQIFTDRKEVRPRFTAPVPEFQE
jgi:hypothetical protein